ncbi:uncharacterized protein STEHIDRAFT_108626 [Stereum hirsutum FP-91666 SS1]|uniref:uncharacterized protein n=1 Tax=Stereum hirsutum (strain FP-91666) TaxID=721885 RepID=UPI000440A6A4|nr:uncharacterized protein STEHIDRAFT_108626 [Stereum hirsutum FP-91666 SS1]EIM90019.1 hypothetical protein STEHIDRAFT_108626 [Stereum hirsutum FP-91666 SS1]
MSDVQKETCSSLSTALASPTPPSPPLPLPSLRKDLISLLSLIYSDATKLSIALKPPKPTYSAGISTTKEFTTHISTLGSNAASFDPNVHGRTLTEEVHRLALSVLDAVRELAHAHRNLLQEGGSKGMTGAAGEDYLVKTAAIHDIVSRAKSDSPSGLSQDNIQAVRKRWNAHGETLNDAVEELDEFIKSAEEDGDEDEDDDEEQGGDGDDNDGWAEAGFDFGSSNKKKSPEQIQLAQTLRPLIHHISKVCAYAGKTMLISPSSTPSQNPGPPPNPSPSSLDALLSTASALTISSDELVSRIEDPSDLIEARNEFADAIDELAKAVDGLWVDAGAGAGEEGKVDDEQKGKEGKRKGSRIWFGLHFANVRDRVRKVEYSKPNEGGE